MKTLKKGDDSSRNNSSTRKKERSNSVMQNVRMKFQTNKRNSGSDMTGVALGLKRPSGNDRQRRMTEFHPASKEIESGHEE